MRPTLTHEQANKVRAALDTIEEAQNLLYSAAQEICSVPGFAPEWNKLCKAGDAAKALWHHIDGKRAGYREAENQAPTQGGAL